MRTEEHRGDRLRPLDERTVVVLYLDATLDFEPARLPDVWSQGALPVAGVADEKLAPTIRNAVVGRADDRLRWHRDLATEPPRVADGWLLAVELLLLHGLDRGSCVLVLHLALPPTASAFALGQPLELTELELPVLLGGSIALSSDWHGGVVQRPLSRPAAVAELVCAPDDPRFLPEPRVRIDIGRWPEYEYRMFALSREEPEPDRDTIATALAEIFPVGHGTLAAGPFRSVAEGDFGNEAHLRTFVVSAVLFGVAQAVILNRLAQLAAQLANPSANPATAIRISRMITSYRAIHAWMPAPRPELDWKIARRYREITGLEALERQLASFEASAQAALSAQTNALLALIAILGVAVAIATATTQAAELHGWLAAVASLGVAAGITGLLLLLPIGRALRAALGFR